MPKRQDIMNAVIERMQEISTDNGYQTNLGTNVEDWQMNWDDSQLPALSVCDGESDEQLIHDEPTASVQINRLPIIFKIFDKVDESEDRAANLRIYIADIKKAIKKDRFWTVGDVQLALWTKPKRSGIVIKEENFEIGGAAVEIEIAYLTESFED